MELEIVYFAVRNGMRWEKIIELQELLPNLVSTIKPNTCKRGNRRNHCGNTNKHVWTCLRIQKVALVMEQDN